MLAPSNGIKQAVTATASLPVMGVGPKPTQVKSNLDDLKQELEKIHTSNSSHNLKANLEANLKEIFAPTSSGQVTPAQTITNSATPTQTNTNTTTTTTTTSAHTTTHDVNHQLTDSEPHFDNKSSESFSNDEGIVFTVRPHTSCSQQTEPTEQTETSLESEQQTQEISSNAKTKFTALNINLDLTQIKSETLDKSEVKEQSLSPKSPVVDNPPPIRKLSRFSVTPVRELASPVIDTISSDGFKADSTTPDCKSDTTQKSLKDNSTISHPPQREVTDRQVSRESSTESSALDFVECNNSVRDTSSQTSPTTQVLLQLVDKVMRGLINICFVWLNIVYRMSWYQTFLWFHIIKTKV